MRTEAIFEKISQRIEEEIEKAKKSIIVAVAWFTNKNLFNTLLRKAQSGCPVYLIISNDSINANSSINYDKLDACYSKCYRIGSEETELMHNKFCVIDFSTVITGSYNWSYKAESNYENVVIHYNATSLAGQFIDEFNRIKRRYYPDEPAAETFFPINKIIKRLEILKNYIQLEDVEELHKEAGKLLEYKFNTDILEIITALEMREYAAAVNKIQQFISQNQQIITWSDPEISALKLQIKLLENQLNAYYNEKAELEKILLEFQHRHHIELGSIILEILKLRKIKYRHDKEKVKEAEQDERQYSENYKREKERKHYELTAEERAELKKKYRKATHLCHPDKVSEEYKDRAQHIFIELIEAYNSNDLQKVTELLNNLEHGVYFKSQSETISEKEKILQAIAELHKKVKALEEEIIAIKQSEQYKTIVSIEDWDTYFKETKEKLKKELEELKFELQ